LKILPGNFHGTTHTYIGQEAMPWVLANRKQMILSSATTGAMDISSHMG
jgi:hypothetical protein